MKKLLFLVSLLASTLAIFPALAAPVRVDAVEVELVSQRDAVAAGQSARLGLRIRHDPHWHSYWRNPGDSGLPTQLALDLPAGWSAGEFIWPAPSRILVGPLASYAYEGDLLLPVEIRVARDAGPGPVRITGKAQWLMCREVCIPGEAQVSLDFRVGDGGVPTVHATQFEKARASTPEQTLTARASLSAGRLSLGWRAQQAKLAEFFPYVQGWLSAPAPQSLFRNADGAESGYRLELALAEDVSRDALVAAGFGARPVGVLRVDGQVYEVRAELNDRAPPAGSLVSVAVAAPDDRATGGSAAALGGLLGGAAGSVKGGDGGSPGRTAAVADRPTSVAAAMPVDLLLAAAFAALGGLILNLMPCVFPVIGLKVLGFATHARAHRNQARRGALAFCAGVLVSFWVLAGLLIALRAAGEAAGWGFQLQSPVFVAAMTLLFVLIGLNFAGLYEIGLGLTRLGQADPMSAGRGGSLASFGSGVLAVLVATPCTAPFMGSALGYTLGRPAAEVMVVFTALGFGMSLPYLLFGFFPAALGWLPRPGRWMESFRQFLAFPMFATAGWLAWVLGKQAGVDAMLGLAIGAVLVALAAWLFGRFVQSGAAIHRVLAGILAIIAMTAGAWVAWPSGQPPAGQGAAEVGKTGGWQSWSSEQVATARADGRPVFVDFTAAWCVSCQANKALVLNSDTVVARMNALKVLRLRADWTNRDPAITAELERHGRTGVPLYLLYLPGEDAPRVLPELLTSGLVLEALSAVR